MKQKKIAEKKIEYQLKKINFNKLKNKSKLLIIACSDKKRNGAFSNNSSNNYFESNEFNEYNFLITLRKLRLFDYLEFMSNNPNYFLYNKNSNPILRDKSGNNLFEPVVHDYFYNCIDSGYMPAFERYDGYFYEEELRRLYFDKNREEKLHILIISGLYGILEFKDDIIDYHFEIGRGPNIMSNYLTKVINLYLDKNGIEHDNVFYSLSNEYLKCIKPDSRWKNIWIKHDRGQTSANFLKEYFLPRL